MTRLLDSYRLHGPSRAAATWRAAPLLIVFIAAVALRHFVVTNWDVSWLITVGEKMLAGGRLGSDILEVNPPASPLLYLPAILLGRLLGITPEHAVDTLIFVAIAASIGLCAHILRRAKAFAAIDGWALLAMTAAVLAILPAFSFSQREHIAAIIILPVLATLTLRAEDGRPGAIEAVLAGVGAGVAVAIKPHFVVAIVLPAVIAAAHARSWRVTFALENWVGAAIAVFYGASVLVFFPDYVTTVLPMVRDLYLSDRLPLLAALVHPAMLLWALTVALLGVLCGKAIMTPPYSLLLGASCGFAVAFVAQDKGWAYHAYPMFALALIAIGAAYADTRRAGQSDKRRWARAAVAIVLAATIVKLCLWFNTSMDTRALAAAIEEIKPRPRLMIVASELMLGHPLVRDLRGQYVARGPNEWITAGVMRRRARGGVDAATEARLRDYEAFDRAVVAEDIRRGRPDVIVIDRREFDWLDWALADPVTRSALQDYKEAKTIESIAIFARKAERP